MFASLQISRPATSVVLVPQTAVIHDGENTGVYIAGSDGKYTFRQVRVGANRGDNVEILSGLSDGERIIKSGAGFLRAPVGD